MLSNILIATFSLRINNKRTSINGMIEPMLSFFLPRKYRIDLIDGYHPGSSNVVSVIERYENGKLDCTLKSLTSLLLYPLLHLQNNNATQILFKVRDFFSVLEWGIRSGNKYDLFIGLESVYTLAGIILKKIGIVKTVVYYVSDYSPNRYTGWFNRLYLELDRICARNADYIWDVSPAMHPARIKEGLNPKKAAPLILVPNALFPKQINPAPVETILPHSLIFAGTLTKSNGPDVAVMAMPEIIKKYKDATLHIFGSNSTDQKRIMDLIQKFNLQKSVIFHGFVKDAVDLTGDIRNYSIGLAPYLDVPGSHRKYGDATKLRLYMGAGIPVVTTNVPPLGKIIAAFGAGIITEDTPKDLAKVVSDLFSNKNKYQSLRKKAIEFAKNNTWENTYKNAFSAMKASFIFSQ